MSSHVPILLASASFVLFEQHHLAFGGVDGSERNSVGLGSNNWKESQLFS